MHRMKLKVPQFFFMEWIKCFCGWIYHFPISLTVAVLQQQKSLPHIGGTTIQDVGHLTVMRAAMEPGVHTMSDELILQISCNIFLAFEWILMMKSVQSISHYTTAKLSVHVWNHDLIWWQNKIDTQQGKSEGFDSCDRPSNLTQIGFKSSICQPVWPRNLTNDLKNKTKGHYFFTTSSFVHHFQSIGDFKLELQSGNIQFESKLAIFCPMWTWNLMDDLRKQ